ncbi:pre-mRNA-splicing factor syf1 [Tulasnella sp. 330]|nr:pre-mRNA-splicing factor syf1 [Tulasnella sp. 330]
MSRLASLHGPSSPSSTPARTPPAKPSPGKSRRSASASLYDREEPNTNPPTESTYHRKLRTLLLELRQATKTWNDLVLLDGLKAAKGIIDARTELDNSLAALPIGIQPRVRLVNPKLANIESRVDNLLEVVSKLKTQFHKMASAIETAELLLVEALDDGVSIDSLTSLFPIAYPTPIPATHPDLISAKDIHREEDLLRNASSFRQWWTSIHAAREGLTAQQRSAVSPHSSEVAERLGQLSTPIARTALQRLTYMFESALTHFPASFKMWKTYLQVRMLFVLGRPIKPKRAGGRKKFPDMREALEDEELETLTYEGALDPVAGWTEWKALVALFERALMYLPNWAEFKGGESLVRVYRRYLRVDPSIAERYTSILLSEENSSPRPLEAAKLLLSLARRAARGEYTSPEGKSPYQLLCDWLDVVEKHAEEVGLDADESDAAEKARAAQEAAEKDAEAARLATLSTPEEPASVNGKLIRFAGPPTLANGAQAKDGPKAYDEDEDPQSPRRLDVAKIIKQDGLAVYKDQAGRLWSGLAIYWTKRSEFDKASSSLSLTAKSTFEAGLADVVTVRDFTQIFDAYAEFSETLISGLMDLMASPDADEEDVAETEKDLDVQMKEFEELMDKRPFLVNEVLLRRNPHDVQEWEKRVVLWGDNDDKVAETYGKALETINPRKATANIYMLYINFARFYEEGGVSGAGQPNLDSARKILEKGVKVNFKAVEDLAEIWCEWAEMEIRNENYEEAIRVMQRAAAIPKNTKISYHDQSLPVQARLFKSLKLWSFYVDLEESIGTVDTAKAAYDKIFELRIANAQIIVNYAAFLEENKYFEESFKVYERGVELFTYPVAFEIWNIYLAKFVKRYGGKKLERARDLFEQALEQCPQKHCKPLFLMYAQLEEEHGLAKRAMNILDRACQAVADQDKFEMYTIYIAKATANFGLPATRPIYEKALEVLPNRQAAQMCLRFAAMERKLGEIDRARAIYAHASQFCDPRVNTKFWQEWNTFEMESGSEDTFREMLRIKRSVQAQYNTEASYLAAQAVTAREGAAREVEGTQNGASDPMAARERDAPSQNKGPAFVAAQNRITIQKMDEPSEAPQGNADEIQIDDDDL